MAADGHGNRWNKQPVQYFRQVDPAIWKACAGTSVRIPEVQSRVYYFPQGHVEHSSAPQAAASALARFSPRPFAYCRVLQVLFLADPDTDEVHARIRLQPLMSNERQGAGSRGSPSSVRGFTLAVGSGGGDGRDGRNEEESVVVSFAKVLTASDANNGGGFSVPRFCADSIFPPLDRAAVPPVQNLTITDVRGDSWIFRHIYRGSPKRNLLTTGWSKFVNSKKLIAGDSVVFMKNKITKKLFVGVRRAQKSNSSMDMSTWASPYSVMAPPKRIRVGDGAHVGVGGIMRTGGGERDCKFSRIGKGKVPPESIVEAVQLAANNMPFEVVYYPTVGSQDFVVAADKVDGAMAMYWTPGMRVKMATETEDSSRRTWFQGTVSSLVMWNSGLWQRSPWRMLQVAWDEPEVLENIKRVSPWQVEFLSPAPPIDAAFPPAKRFKFPQNYSFLTDGEADFTLPLVRFSSSALGHLSSSYLNYNTFPAGMQGARQDTFCVSSIANIINNGTRQLCPVGFSDGNLVHKAETVSTDLNMGNSQSDIISLDSSSCVLSSSPDDSGPVARSAVTEVDKSPVWIFGRNFQMDNSMESLKSVGTSEHGANKRMKQNEGFGNSRDLRLSEPHSKVSDRIDVPRPTAPTLEPLLLSIGR